MSIITNHKVMDPQVAEMIADFLKTAAVMNVNGKRNKVKLPKTKHVGKPQYGMKSKRYA